MADEELASFQRNYFPRGNDHLPFNNDGSLNTPQSSPQYDPQMSDSNELSFDENSFFYSNNVGSKDFLLTDGNVLLRSLNPMISGADTQPNYPTFVSQSNVEPCDDDSTWQPAIQYIDVDQQQNRDNQSNLISSEQVANNVQLSNINCDATNGAKFLPSAENPIVVEVGEDQNSPFTVIIIDRSSKQPFVIDGTVEVVESADDPNGIVQISAVPTKKLATHPQSTRPRRRDPSPPLVVADQSPPKRKRRKKEIDYRSPDYRADRDKNNLASKQSRQKRKAEFDNMKTEMEIKRVRIEQLEKRVADLEEELRQKYA